MEIKSIWGHKIDNKNKRKRIKKYIMESIPFAISMMIIYGIMILISSKKTVWYFWNNYTINYIITVLIVGLIMFFLSLLFSYIVCEIKIKKNVKNK